MNNPDPDNANSFRSPLLMNRNDTAVLVVDVQEKLLPHIEGAAAVSWNIGRLLRAAGALGVKYCVTEQYPKGLGPTVPEIMEHATSPFTGTAPEKLMFSCRECSSLFEELTKAGVHRILVCGIEAHVCVLQSVLDLIASGFEVYICTDAIGSRCEQDKDVALKRMESSGATLVTTEMAMFEWCEVAGSPEFKVVSKLVQEKTP